MEEEPGEPPSADFSGDPTSGYTPLTVDFSDMSTPGGGGSGPSGFSVDVTASSSSGSSLDLTFGMEEGATDGFDLGTDEYAPPAPPSGFDAALSWDGDRYYTQMLSPNTQETTMSISVSELYSLSWDPAAYSSEGQFTLTDNFGGEFLSIDMSSTGYVDESTSPQWGLISTFFITFTAKCLCLRESNSPGKW